MATIEDTVRQIRVQISAVQSKKARAAVELDSAKDRLAQARAILKDEFGVTTTADAKAKLAELKAELDACVAQIETLLAEAGA